MIYGHAIDVPGKCVPALKALSIGAINPDDSGMCDPSGRGKCAGGSGFIGGSRPLGVRPSLSLPQRRCGQPDERAWLQDQSR